MFLKSVRLCVGTDKKAISRLDEWSETLSLTTACILTLGGNVELGLTSPELIAQVLELISCGDFA